MRLSDPGVYKQTVRGEFFSYMYTYKNSTSTMISSIRGEFDEKSPVVEVYPSVRLCDESKIDRTEGFEERACLLCDLHRDLRKGGG